MQAGWLVQAGCFSSARSVAVLFSAACSVAVLFWTERLGAVLPYLLSHQLRTPELQASFGVCLGQANCFSAARSVAVLADLLSLAARSGLTLGYSRLL